MLITNSEISDNATIQNVGSEESGMPGTNLQSKQPTDVWRATTLSSAFTEWQLSRVRPIDFVALLYHNMTDEGKVQVRAATSQSNLTSDPAYDSGILSARSFKNSTTLIWSDEEDNPSKLAYDRNHFILDIGSDQTFEWWRIDCFDSNHPDGFIQAGRAYLDNAFRPSRSVRFGWGLQWMDDQRRHRTRGQQIYQRVSNTSRRLTGDFTWDSKSDAYDDLFQIKRKRGSAKDVFIITDISDTARLQDWSIYGLLTDIQPIVNIGPGIYETSITIEEMI